jgi:hypothetical protein
MKKFVWSVCTLVLMCALFTACGDDDSGHKSQEPLVITGAITADELLEIMSGITVPVLDLSGATVDLDDCIPDSDCWPPVLTKLILPDNCDVICLHFFEGAQYLQEIAISAGNDLYKTVGGVLYFHDDGEIVALVQYPAARPGANFTLPATVEIIGYGAFSGSVNLKKLTLAGEVWIEMQCFSWSSVEEIAGDYQYIAGMSAYAFNFSQLKHITLGGQATEGGWGRDFFIDCENLEWVALPDTINPPSLDGFNGNPHDFVGCTSLTAVYVPDECVALYQGHEDDSIEDDPDTGLLFRVGWKFVNAMNGGGIIKPASTMPVPPVTPGQ